MASGESRGCHRGSSVKGGMFAAFSSASIVCMEVVRSPRREVNGVSCGVAMAIELIQGAGGKGNGERAFMRERETELRRAYHSGFNPYPQRPP